MTTSAESYNVDRSSVPLLEMRGVSKTFPGVKALDNVSLKAWGGEVGNDILNGKIPEQPTSLIAPQLITRDNVGQYHGW